MPKIACFLRSIRNSQFVLIFTLNENGLQLFWKLIDLVLSRKHSYHTQKLLITVTQLNSWQFNFFDEEKKNHQLVLSHSLILFSFYKQMKIE